jgi:parallel beta-helix repeat protein
LTSNIGTSVGLNGIYLYNFYNNTLINNVGRSNANNGIVLTIAFNNILENNTAISTGPESALNLQDSFNNSFINQIAIANGTSGLERYAIYIESSNSSLFRDCINISGSVYDVHYTTPSLSVNNTFINCSYSTSKELVQGTGSQLVRKWYYQAYVNYSNGTAAAGANVSAYNVSSSPQFTENTNGSGWIQRKEVIEYVNTGGTRIYYNNYTINSSKAGYATDNNIWNFTTQQNKLNDWFTLYNNTCQYDLGNWFINCSDNCSISTNYNIAGNNISVVGVGTVTFSGNISNYNKLFIAGQNSANICRVRCINGGCFKN